MRRKIRTLSLIIFASMLLQLCSCADKALDKIPKLAEDICGDVSIRDYDKLMEGSRFEDEALEEIFDLIGEDEAKEMIADTLTYEIDPDSLQKTDKSSYSIDVTFSYVDHTSVLEDENIVSADDFKAGIQDSSELIEVNITLVFHKDGSDLFFMNIGDMEKLFPYADDEIMFHEAAEELTDEDLNTEDLQAESDPAEITETEDREDDDDGVIDISDPNHRDIDGGDTFVLPGTDILVTVPEDATVDDRSLRNAVDIRCNYVSDDDTDFYTFMITTEGFSGYDPYYGDTVMDQYIAQVFSEWDESYGWYYQNPDTEFVIGGTSYPARWITSDSDSIYHAEIYIVAFGDEDVCYLLVFAVTDQAYADDVIGSFSMAS